LLDAPTGFGKSIVNVTLGRSSKSAFYITPQLTLIDQVRKDKSIGQYVMDIKGRQNYPCHYDPAATCDVGVCRRVKTFDCQKAVFCQYWKQKMRALDAQIALMSFAYFILEGNVETDFSFGRRELLILDESHSIDRHVISHISLTVSPWSVPFELYKKVANDVGNIADFNDAVRIVRLTMDHAKSEIDHTEAMVQLTLEGGELSITQATNLKRLTDFVSNADRFLTCVEEIEWVYQLGWASYHGNQYPKLVLQPLYARPFMQDMVWSRAEYYIVSSATLLNIPIFVRETGLDKMLSADKILHIRVPSTFPVENRPIIDRTNGRLTRDKIEENIRAAVQVLERILDQEEGKNVAVHCHSYNMSIRIQNLIDSKYKLRLVIHTPENRQEALESWKNSHGKVFLSVSFEEGQDWVGEICEAQVLFKVPYLDISDRRVARRLEKRDWAWYRNEAMKTVIQSYGRAVRSPEDKARYYVIDSCFIDLIQRCKKDIPAWFKEALPLHMRTLIE
jgi:Rad3-related DNA helicase